MPKTNGIKKFIFESYKLDRQKKVAIFEYSLDDSINFREIIKLPKEKVEWNKVNKKLLDKTLFNLHLILGIGYYKTYCPKKIEIKSGQLNKEQANFWNKIYKNGLGEFFYQNKIDGRNLIKFPFQNIKSKPISSKFKDRCLSPIGGGKDSILAAEILKELGHDFSLISLRDSIIQKDTSKVVGEKRLIFGREIDKKLFQLNKEGAFNGHIPISAIYSWISILAAVIYNYKYITFANEASANFGNTIYLGEEINHQYSKSFEFENDLRDYIKRNLSAELQYFSILRQFSELKIAKEFSKFNKYFPYFSSCNRNFKINNPQQHRWCGECPKCLFTFSLLAAYNDKNILMNIFGRNLLNDKRLLIGFQELWGEKKIKPFDCVGTPDEVRAAMILASKQKSWQESYIVKYFNKNIRPKINNEETLIESSLYINSENNIPDNFKKILILGWGKEGKYLHRYYRGKYPYLHLWVSDKNKITGKIDKFTSIVSQDDYLKNLQEFDVIAKSPGIAMGQELLAARRMGVTITSVLDIFLHYKRDLVIGVTGTKGKSTTSSLIHHILKKAGIKTHLVGNIGNNPLIFLKEKKESIFVYEMSSYQLETIKTSPKIAVFVSLFADHLPYHGGFDNYLKAKTNISLHQKPKDKFIYNGDFPLIKKATAKSLGEQIDYSGLVKIKDDYLLYKNKKVMKIKDVPLPGKHNLKNIGAVLSAVEMLGVSPQKAGMFIKSFKPLPHRLEKIGTYKNITFYDDAISTTPESTLAAIEYLKNDIGSIILGGEDRGFDFKSLAEKICSLDIKAIVLFPNSGEKILSALKSSCRKERMPKIMETKNMEQAVKFLYKNTPKEKTCLLSTASPSYTVFKNFEEKGDLFKKYVKKYSKL